MNLMEKVGKNVRFNQKTVRNGEIYGQVASDD